MSSDIYSKLTEAENALRAAEMRAATIKRKIAQQENAFREALPIGENVPCAVAVLPSGKVAVHVWVEGSSQPNQLHIVTPGYYDEEARPRKKFPNEQLGGP